MRKTLEASPTQCCWSRPDLWPYLNYLNGHSADWPLTHWDWNYFQSVVFLQQVRISVIWVVCVSFSFQHFLAHLRSHPAAQLHFSINSYNLSRLQLHVAGSDHLWALFANLIQSDDTGAEIMYFNLVIWSIIKYFTPFAFVSICLIFSSNSSRQRSVFCWVEFQLKALVWECESNEISNGARPIVSLPNKAHYFCHFLSAKIVYLFYFWCQSLPTSHWETRNKLPGDSLDCLRPETWKSSSWMYFISCWANMTFHFSP